MKIQSAWYFYLPATVAASSHPYMKLPAFSVGRLLISIPAKDVSEFLLPSNIFVETKD